MKMPVGETAAATAAAAWAGPCLVRRRDAAPEGDEV